MILKINAIYLEKSHKYLELNQMNCSHLQTNRRGLEKNQKHLQTIHYYLDMT